MAIGLSKKQKAAIEARKAREAARLVKKAQAAAPEPAPEAAPQEGAPDEDRDLQDAKALLAAEEHRALQEQIALLKRQAAAYDARDDFMQFVKFTCPHPEAPHDVTKSTYQDARHHRAIAHVIEEVEAGGIPFLILTMPPRHGKSELVSRRLPAWYVGRHPTENVVVATYNDNFAADFGAEVRRIMVSPAYRQVFPEVRLARGGGAKDRLQTLQGGLLTFVGRGGSLTGRGAHILICDDLIKDAEEARSKAIRDQAWEWFTKVAMSRRMGKKLVVITFTRWHADDPIGRLTDPENPCYNPKIASKIKVINLPAIAEDDDPLGRAPGEPLWPDGPDKFDLDFLEEQRALDPLGFEALYQQRPTVADGVLFRRENVRFYDQMPETLRFYCASDHAVSTEQRADSTVLLKGGVDANGDIYLVDCWWQKARTDQVVEAMLSMGGGNMRPLIWWAEKGHISKSIGPFLYKRMAETQTYFNVVEVTPSKDKETRAQAIAARVGMGRVFFPRDAWWTQKAVEQLLAFPNGLHDDFVDALAWLGLGLQAQIPAGAAAKAEIEPKFGTLGWVKMTQRWQADQARRASNGGW